MRRSKFAVKELQGLPRILDTLAYAYEFIVMPTPSEQGAGLAELRMSILRLYPELKACYIFVPKFCILANMNACCTYGPKRHHHR